MHDPKREQRAHEIAERLPVAAVQLCDCEEREGERDYVEEVGVAADGDLEWVRGGRVGGVGGVFCGLWERD